MPDQKFVAASAIALVVTLAGIFWMRPLARRVGLVDRPSGRKRHRGRVPLVGGLCFFIGTGAGVVYYGPPDRFTANLLGVGSFIVLTGLIDDLEDLSAQWRLLIQACASALMIATTGVYVNDIGPLLGQEAVHLYAVGIPVTILAVVGLVNAFNMLDGIDGLAGSMALVSIVAILTYASADWPGSGAIATLQILGLTMVPYLLVNLGWPDGRRIFMGDAGSTLVGFVLAFSLIRLSQPNGEPLAPVDTLWCVALPVMDTLTVMYRRMRRKLSPLAADRRHLHYRLLDAGFTPRATLALIVAIATMLVGMGYLLREAPEPASLAVFVACLLLYVYRMPSLVAWLARFAQGRVAVGGRAAFQRYRALREYGSHARAVAATGPDADAGAAVAQLAPAAITPIDAAAAMDRASTNALCVLGAAAEYAPILPVIRQLAGDRRFRTRICIAAADATQGAQQLRDAVGDAELDLQIVRQESEPGEITAALGDMQRVFDAFRPDLVLTYGESPGVLATALMAREQHVPMARLARKPGSDDRDELSANIVRLLSARRFPAAESGHPDEQHDTPTRAATNGNGGAAMGADRSGEGRDDAGIVEALLELSRQRMPQESSTSPRPSRVASPAERTRSMSAGAETN